MVGWSHLPPPRCSWNYISPSITSYPDMQLNEHLTSVLFVVLKYIFGRTKTNLQERDLNLRPSDWRAGARPTEPTRCTSKLYHADLLVWQCIQYFPLQVWNWFPNSELSVEAFLLYPSLHIIQVKWLHPCLFDRRTLFCIICSEHRINICVICVWIIPFVYYHLKGAVSSRSEQTFNRAWTRCPSLM